MQRISIRELQHNLSSLIKLVKSGQGMEVYHRKTLVARIVPPDSREKSDWTSHEREIMAIFKGRTLQRQNRTGIISETRHDF